MATRLPSYVTILIILLVVPVLFLALALLILETKLDPDFNVAWFITSFSILSSVGGMFFFTCRNIEEISKTIENTNEQIPKDILELISRELRNTRIPLHGVDEVRQEVAKLYNEANSETETGEKIISYFGAASIYPTRTELEKIEADIDSDGGNIVATTLPAFIIQASFDRITVPSSGVTFNRYIKLPSTPELIGRSKSYLTNLANWLDRQAEVIERCPTYTLYAAARTFEFSSLTSIVAGPSGVVEIIGNGHGGSVVRSQAERRNYVKSVISFMNEAEEHNQPKPFNKGNLLELLDRIKNIRNVIKDKKD